MGAYEFGDCTRFIRGDVDANGTIEISDPIFLLSYLFLAGAAPDCLDAGDVAEDGALDLTDAIASLLYQFLAGPAPTSPFPNCGIKTRTNALNCLSFPFCN